jgi:trimeric autotransporter adhesin
VKRTDTSHPYVREGVCPIGSRVSNSWDRVRIFSRVNRKWLNAFLAGALMVLVPGFAAAQGNVARPRVVDRVDDATLTVLRGNTHPLAQAQFDRGAAPPNLPMDRIMLVLQRSPEQEAALKGLLDQQQDQSSPNFHKWLTPDQFGQQFGPADQDIQVVTSWLSSHGFQSVKVSRGRTTVEFSGTAAQVESALHTAIHKYTVNGADRWANVSDPQIPAALAPVISAVVSLHNFPKKPLFVRSGQQGVVKRTPGAKPQVNLTDNNGTIIHALAPADFAKIYNINNPTTMTGAGVTIGVTARSNINVSDVTLFRSMFGLSTNDPQVILNGPDPGDLGDGDEIEAVLDATWTGAVAPGAAVKFVVSEDTNSTQGVDLSEIYIIDNNLADVMTESFSACEAIGFTQSSAATVSMLAEQAAAQGITYLVASGDGGPDSCDTPSTLPTSPTASVNILAATPFTVAVGGTQFNENGNPNTYWKSTSDPTTGESVISYIPEDVWNESCSGTCPNGIGIWSSGGGQSTFFSKPSWQTGVPGIPSSATGRMVPDVSVSAADHDGYVLCVAGGCQTGSVDVISGTSASAQAFGGIMALVVQQKGRQGQANYVFYKLAVSSSCNASNPSSPPNISTCIFNDVTVGNTNIPGNTGFDATVGYDQATGLGSVNVANLISNWSSAISHASATTLKLNGGTTQLTLTHGQSVNVAITVAATASGLSVVPIGDVSLIAHTTPGGGADFFTLDGTGNFAGPTTLLPGSPTPYNVTAHYAGDVAFLASDSAPVSVIVNPEASKTTANIVVPSGNGTTTATSVVYGSPYVLEVDVMNFSGTTLCKPNTTGGPACPTGTVTVKDGANLLDAGTFTLNSLGFFEDQPIQLPVGTHSIVATYAGDSSFTGSTSATDTVTVTPASTTTTIAANPSSVAAGGTVTLTAIVSSPSNALIPAQEPTGTVQFFNGGTMVGAPVTVVGSTTSFTAQSTATMTIPPAAPALANGQYQFTAHYVGDNNYSGSTSAATTVSVGVPGINVSSSTGTINISAPGQSGTQLITVSAANGFTGSVTLSCAVSSPSGAVYPPTCSFGTPGQNFVAPNIIALSSTNTSGNATMTVATTPKQGIVFNPASRPQGPNFFLVSEVAAFIACFFLLGITAQKRPSFVLLAMLLFAVIAVGTGCGGSYGGGGGGSNPGTTIGAYTVAVTATPAGAAAQTTAITVNVQ